MPILKEATGKAVALVAAVGLVLATALSLLGRLADARPTQSVQGTLHAMASEITKKCPIPVDRETVLVKAAAGPGLRLRYQYAMRRTVMELATVDVDALGRSLRQDQLAKLRATEGLRPLLDAGVTWEFAYSSSDGHRVLSVELTPADYR